MKKILSIFAIAGTLLFAGCSTDEPDDITPAEPAPKLVSWTQEGSASSQTVVLTFDQNVMCPTAERGSITVNNGATIASIDAYMADVTVRLADLEPESSYELRFPKGTIKGYKENIAEEVSVTVKTPEVPKPVEQEIAEKLVTENPIANAVRLYDYLRSIYGYKSLSSAIAKVNWNTDEADWIAEWTGKYPAIATFDYIHLCFSPANWIDYGDITPAKKWFDAGGIVSACWHWNVPKRQGSNDYTCTPSETEFKSSNALIEGTWENDCVKADLEKIAGYLLQLQDEGIPVIWRPLHEAAGNTYTQWHSGAWFWWGAAGAENYKALWRTMFDCFRNAGLRNLIWVWTTQTSSDEDSDYAFYPGDDYVDIIGKDIYNNSSAAAIFSEYNAVLARTPRKMITLSEFGNVAPIASQWSTGAKWLYFMPWYDYDNDGSEGYKHEHATISWWKEAFDSDMVIDRSQLPSDLYE